MNKCTYVHESYMFHRSTHAIMTTKIMDENGHKYLLTRLSGEMIDELDDIKEFTH